MAKSSIQAFPPTGTYSNPNILEPDIVCCIHMHYHAKHFSKSLPMAFWGPHSLEQAAQAHPQLTCFLCKSREHWSTEVRSGVSPKETPQSPRATTLSFPGHMKGPVLKDFGGNTPELGFWSSQDPFRPSLKVDVCKPGSFLSQAQARGAKPSASASG